MFDYYNPVKVTVSQNGLVAMTDKFDSILVWRQREEEIAPSGENGSIIAIIFNKYEGIRFIRWILASDYLALKSNNELIILDVYENREIIKTNYTDDPYLVMYRDGIYAVLSTSNRIKYFNSEINWDLQPLKGMVWLENEFITNKSVRYDISEGGIVREDRGENDFDRKIKRRLKKDTDLDPKNFFTFSILEYDPEELIIKESHLHHLREQDDLTLHFLNDILVYQTPKGLLITQNSIDTTPLFIPGSNAQVIPYALHENMFIVIFPNKEFQVSVDHGILKVQSFHSIISDTDIALNNTIISFLIDSDLDIAYSKMNTEYGYMWLDDLSEYHLFLDLLTNQIYFVQNSIHRQNVDVFVNEQGTFILEWEKGNGYPEGQLIYREIDDINNPIMLYNVKENDTSENTDSSLGETDEEFGPLVIPAWNLIDLNIIYNKEKFDLRLSKSSLFIYMDYWSKLDYLETIDIDDSYPIDFAFLKFCDLKINWKEKTVPFEAISPYYILNKQLGRLITYSIDQFLYVWDLETSVPLNRVKTGLPLKIVESKDGSFLGIISFNIEKVDLIPASDDDEPIPSEYPHIVLQVTNLKKSKTYTRTYPFPTHLIETKINLTQNEGKFVFEFPSYIDKESLISLVFDIKNSKFSMKIESELTKFWKSHTLGLETLQSGKGDEFPVNPHPEIDREAVKRKFTIVDEGLYRKSDGECFISIFTHSVKIKQKSNDQVLSHQGKHPFDVPFAGGKNRPIYLLPDAFDKVKDHELVKLEDMTELPKVIEASTVVTRKSDIYLKRLNEFIVKIIEDNVVHDENAILFYSNEFLTFQKSIMPILKRVEKRTKKKNKASKKKPETGQKSTRKKSTKKTTRKGSSKKN